MSADDPNEELELAVMEEALAKSEDDDEEYVMIAQQAISHSEAPIETHDGWLNTVKRKFESIKVFWFDVLDEVKNTPEATTEVETKEAPEAKLNTKLLRNNVKRLSSALKPFQYYHGRFNEVTSWHKPYETGFALFVYIFCCYFQLLMPAILLWALTLLARGYARKQGYLKQVDQEEESSDSRTLFEQAGVVMDVAKQVQNRAGRYADALERVINLLTWEEPKKTWLLVRNLTLGFVALLVVPFWVLLTVAKIYLGWKVFVIEALYQHYPNLKVKHSTSFWTGVPTNADVAFRKIEQKDDSSTGASLSTSTDNNSTASAPASLRHRTGSIVRSSSSSKTATPESSAAAITLEKVPARLVELGVADTDTVEQSWQCVWLENQRLTSPRKGRLYLTSNYVGFLRSSEEDHGSFAYSRDRLLAVDRGKSNFLTKNLSFQMEFKPKTPEEATILRQFTGVTNITDLLAKFASSQESRSSSISGAVLPLPPM
eukprot:m.293143 g.293143  ORF g.293143 m.293143 type:complete len:487 (-) comp18630_c0_seq1:76-1536(-)